MSDIAETNTVPLSLIEIVGGGYVDIDFVYEDGAAPSIEELQIGVNLFASQFPWIAGNIVDGSKIVFPTTTTAGPTVIDGGEVDATLEGFNGGDFNGPSFVHSYTASTPASTEVLLLKYTRIQGGVVIGYSLHHQMGDAHGAGLVARALAEFTRTGAFTGSLQIDRELIDASFDLAHTEPVEGSYLNFREEKVPGSIVAGCSFDGNKTFLIKFSEEEAQTMKVAAQARAARYGHSAPISSRDALTGHLWQLHLQATHLANIEEGVEESVDRAITLGVACDARPRLELPSDLVACCNMLIMTRPRSALKELLGGAGPAWAIREGVLAQTKEKLSQLGGWINHVSEGKNVEIMQSHMDMNWCHGETEGFGDSCCTDWSREGWYEVAFKPETRPFLVVPVNAPVPGYFRTTEAPEGGFLAWLHASGRTAKYFEEGGVMHERMKDLEFVGTEQWEEKKKGWMCC